MSKDNRNMTNTALLSIAEYLNEEEHSQQDEEIQEKPQYKRSKELSCRVKITLKKSDKARLLSMASSQYLPLATFCTRAVMGYVENFEKISSK